MKSEALNYYQGTYLPFIGVRGLMKINLNGKIVESESKTLMDLVQEQGFDPAVLVAEVNLEVIRQDIWQEFSVNEGDTIELLSFVGGG